MWKNHPDKLGTAKGKSTIKWLHALRTQQRERECPQCNRHLLRYLKYDVAPPFIAFAMKDLKMRVDNQIVLQEIDQMYRLCGIIYIADKHFICRIVDKSGGVWLHDGVQHREHVLYYDNIINFPYQKLQSVDKYTMTLVLYTKL